LRLSYRDVEELTAERGIEVDHVTVYRWVQTFTPEFIDAARPCRHARGNRWFVDQTPTRPSRSRRGCSDLDDDRFRFGEEVAAEVASFASEA
jgi:hypothetical protein